MPEINEKEFKREPGSCVIHDDDHGWGGPDETIPTEKKLKLICNDCDRCRVSTDTKEAKNDFLHTITHQQRQHIKLFA